jgi:hypothetical protein
MSKSSSVPLCVLFFGLLPLLTFGQDERIPFPKAKIEAPAPMATKVQPSTYVADSLRVCDLASNWKRDVESKGKIAAGGSARVNFDSGQFALSATAQDGPGQWHRNIETALTGQPITIVDLSPIRAAQLQKESKAQAMATTASPSQQETARREAAQVPERKDSDAARGIWIDHSTGLEWTKEDNGSGVDWEQAKDYCSKLQFDRHNDWRLPTNLELLQLMDYGVDAHGLKTSNMRGSLRSSGTWVWSEEASAFNENLSDKGLGDIPTSLAGSELSKVINGSYENGRVLCVRGQENTSAATAIASRQAQQIRLRDETIRLKKESQTREQKAPVRMVWRDSSTGLQWTNKDNGSDMNWTQAKEYCQNLQLAGHADWRLPTIDELVGIYDANAVIPMWTSMDSWHVKGNLLLSGWEWSSSQQDSDSQSPKTSVKVFVFNDHGGFNSPLQFHTRFFTIDHDSNGRALCVRLHERKTGGRAIATRQEQDLARQRPQIGRPEPAAQNQRQNTPVSGIWRDPSTGLEWTNKDNGSDINWTQARVYCRDLPLGSYGDWRLPTIDELQGIFEEHDTKRKMSLLPPVGSIVDPSSLYAKNHYVKGNIRLSGNQWSSSLEDPYAPERAMVESDDTVQTFPLKFSSNARALCVRRP